MNCVLYDLPHNKSVKQMKSYCKVLTRVFLFISVKGVNLLLLLMFALHVCSRVKRFTGLDLERHWCGADEADNL